jgi:nucleotide-binding universal stress UspA family protein
MINMNALLCPVDFSDFSRHALTHAVQLARWFEAGLTVLHVYPTPAAPPPVVFGGLPGPIPPGDLFSAAALSSERLHDEVLARLSAFTSTADVAGITLNLEARSGSPAGRILDEADRLHSDLVVLGTHGHSGFEHWILGSVTEKVLRKAVCPVLTVPPPVGDAPGDPRQMFGRILCGIDFSDTSLKGVEYALALAEEADAELLLMHVIEGLPDPPDWQQPPGPAVVEYLRLSEENALARLREVVPHDARTWCQPHIVLTTGKPHHEILRIARERDAHLIVLGVHGRRPIDTLFFGSTTNHVVRAAPCPVLTVRG